MNVLRLINEFNAAAVDATRWQESLRHLADATGCARAQLIGIGGPKTAFFNILSVSAESEQARFDEVGSYDPAVNFRVSAAAKAAPMTIATEADYDIEIPALIDDAYLDYCHEVDMPFGCQTSLLRNADCLIGLSLLRTRSDGRSNEDQQAIFAAVAPHVRNAVQVQQVVEMQSDKLIIGAFETMQAACFTCDARGSVQNYSLPAEHLLRNGALSLVGGRLAAPLKADDDALNRALARAIAQPSGIVSTALTNGGDPLQLKITALPDRCWNFDKKPRLLVVVQGRSLTDAGPIAMLRTAYGLTEAEAHVALGYGRGKSRDTIANERGVSVHTIRVQTKAIFGKMAVNREVALAALAGRFL